MRIIIFNIAYLNFVWYGKTHTDNGNDDNNDDGYNDDYFPSIKLVLHLTISLSLIYILFFFFYFGMKNIHILEYNINLGGFHLLPDRFGVATLNELKKKLKNKKRKKMYNVECVHNGCDVPNVGWMDGWFGVQPVWKRFSTTANGLLLFLKSFHIHSIFHCSVFNLFIYDSGLFLPSLDFHHSFNLFAFVLCHRWLICAIQTMQWPKPMTAYILHAHSP